MCPVRYREVTNAFMAWDAYARVVDQLPELTELHLQGLGEPLLHPRFFDMVEYAVARGVTVSVNTNLTLLTPAKAERAATCGLSAIYVSVDGATPETYERSRARCGARARRRAAAAAGEAGPARAGDAGALALRLAVARPVRRLRRDRYAVLHGRHARPGLPGQRRARGRGSGLERRRVRRLPRAPGFRRPARDLQVVQRVRSRVLNDPRSASGLPAHA